MKINTMQIKVLCLETLVSSRPVNADCSFNETSPIENKYDVIMQSEIAVSSVYLNFGIHFGAPPSGNCITN
jgi:hypothetical protein